MKIIALLILSFTLFGCDALRNDPFKVTTSTTVAGSSGTSVESCNSDWKVATNALHELADKQNALAFKTFSDAIPAAKSSVVKCAGRDEVVNALDLQMDSLQKWADSNFEFVVFLGRVQYLAETGLMEAICSSGREILKKDAVSFLKALKQERSRFTGVACFTSVDADLVDPTPEQAKNVFGSLRTTLMNVTDADLLGVRDEMLSHLPKL